MSDEYAVVLTGGGARGAYQAGVLKGLGEILEKHNLQNPFSVYSGTSAGAINVAGFTSFLGENKDAFSELTKLWSDLNNDVIYRTDTWSFIQNSYRWMRSLSLGGRGTDYRLLSLFDASPLHELLKENLNFEAIHQAIENKKIKALSVAAVSYGTGVSKTFYETNDPSISPWVREKRIGVKERLSLEHILASSSIPMLFPPVKVGDEYYGDGSLRDYSPLSAPIKLGANKLFVVGVRKRNDQDELSEHIPTPGRILSVVLNGILLDALDLDYERLTHINSTLNHLSGPADNGLRPIDVLMITPSRKISEIAEEETSSLKGTLRYFVKGLGNLKDSADLISYILFETRYIQKLIELGRGDAHLQEKEILEFFGATQKMKGPEGP